MVIVCNYSIVQLSLVLYMGVWIIGLGDMAKNIITIFFFISFDTDIYHDIHSHLYIAHFFWNLQVDSHSTLKRKKYKS